MDLVHKIKKYRKIKNLLLSIKINYLFMIAIKINAKVWKRRIISLMEEVEGKYITQNPPTPQPHKKQVNRKPKIEHKVKIKGIANKMDKGKFIGLRNYIGYDINDNFVFFDIFMCFLCVFAIFVLWGHFIDVCHLCHLCNLCYLWY